MSPNLIRNRLSCVRCRPSFFASVFHYDIPQQRNNDEILSAL